MRARAATLTVGRPSPHDSHLPFMSPVTGRQLSWGRLAVALWLNSGAYASPFGPSRDHPGLLRESHDRFGDRYPRATQDLYRSIVNRAAAPRRQDLVLTRLGERPTASRSTQEILAAPQGRLRCCAEGYLVSPQGDVWPDRIASRTRSSLGTTGQSDKGPKRFSF